MELAVFLAAQAAPQSPPPPEEGSAPRHQSTSQTLDPEVRLTCSRPAEPLTCLWR